MAEPVSVQEAAKAQAITPTTVLGEMAWLYAKSDLHRDWPMRSIEQWLLPAIVSGQYKLYRKNDRPVGLITWAHLSAEVETAYVLNPRSLKPKDWQSGDRNWIIDFIAPFGDALRIGHDLRTNIFPNEVGRILQVKKGSDTMKIAYIHGARAVDKARDWDVNPTVDLGQAKDAQVQ